MNYAVAMPKRNVNRSEHGCPAAPLATVGGGLADGQHARLTSQRSREKNMEHLPPVINKFEIRILLKLDTDFTFSCFWVLQLSLTCMKSVLPWNANCWITLPKLHRYSGNSISLVIKLLLGDNNTLAEVFGFSTLSSSNY